MKNQVIIKIGYISYALHFIVLCLYFLTLLADPNGAGVIISLILGVPFFLLGVVGCWMIGRTSKIPSLYIFVSNVALAIIYFKSFYILTPILAGLSALVGVAAILSSVVISFLALLAKRNYSDRKCIIIGALAVLIILCLAAIIFLVFYSFLVTPGNGVSPLPI